MIDTSKPMEAVRKSDGKTVPVTLDRMGGYHGDEDDGRFLTKECPDGSETNELWNADGSDFCYYDKWFVRNVASTGRTFMIDHRDNAKLHELYLGYATETLEVLDNAIREFDEHSRVNSGMIAGTLRKERARLVFEDAAYFEAAAISHVGADWFREASGA